MSNFVIKSFKMRQTSLPALFFFLVLSFFFCLPLLRNLNISCRGDWDYFSHLYEVASVTTFEYAQLPLWNPYSGGGLPLIGNPQSGFPSPIFFVTSLFGVLPGLKISVWLHTFLGLWGNWLLAGQLGIRGPARFAPPVIFMFSSAWALHIAEGHIVWLPAAIIPLLVLGYLKGLDDARWLVFAAACQSTMVYEGGTYVLGYGLVFLGIYALGLGVQSRSWRPLLALIAVNLVAAGLSAPKLLPVLQLLGGHPRLAGAAESVSWDQLIGSLIDRDGSLAMIEINCYLGLLVAVLYILSLFRVKGQFPLMVASLSLLAVAIGNFAGWAPWTLLHALPFFRNFQCPTRVLIVFCFSASILVGLLLGQRDQKEPVWMPYLVWLMVIGIAADLFSLGSGILGETAKPMQVSFLRFDGGPRKLENPAQLYRVLPGDSAGIARSVASMHAPFSQTRVPGLLRFAHGGWSDQYPHLLHNCGVVDAYETVPFDRHARAAGDPDYSGEYYLAMPGNGAVSLVKWSPNKFVYHVALKKDNILVINQNYWPGWRTSQGVLKSFEGMLSVDLKAGEYDLSVNYLPGGFLVGVAIFLASLAAALFFVATNARSARRWKAI